MLEVDDDPYDGALPLRNFDLKLLLSALFFAPWKSASLSGELKLLMDLLKLGLELLSFSCTPVRVVV